MKRFLLKLFLFLLPVLLFSAIPIYIQLWSREDFYNIDFAIKNAPHTSLFGYAYNEENYRYLKYKTILENDPVEVMAIGSSRVLQFRQNMFETSFYNAGYVVETIADFQAFLSILPTEKLPRLLIIGLDQWMFNANKDQLLRANPPTWWTTNLSLNRKKSVQNFLRIYKDIATQKINLSQIDFSRDDIFKVGLYARLDSSGFRQDGSFYYGRQISRLENNDPTASDFQFAETLARVEDGIIGFEHGDQFNENAVKVFEDCLLFCQQHHIYVICFLPPFADVVYKRMKENGNHTYLNQIESQISKLQKEYDFDFFVYNQVSDCGSTDNECIDGRHGSEKTYARLLIDMLQNGSILNDVCCSLNLQHALDDSKSRYRIFTIF